MQEQEQIFEKFRQGTTSTGNRDHVTREYGGTGLGLSIVRELSRLLGGDVYLESEFGKGSIFMVRLPIAAPPVRKPQTLESPSDTALNRITSVDLMTGDGDDDAAENDDGSQQAALSESNQESGMTPLDTDSQ